MRYLKIASLAALIALFLTLSVGAHEVGMRAAVQVRAANGNTITYSESTLPANAQVTSVRVAVGYSTGEPMARGRIEIYAPDPPNARRHPNNPPRPWQTGTLSARGEYTFRPDLSRRGRWTIRVEQNNHTNFILLII
ncbi:MAG: hypothetical protein ACFCVB_05520 [Nodosilinea sp.]